MWLVRYHARRIVRNIMNPMKPEHAKKWLIRVRALYLVLATTSFWIAYNTYNQNKEMIDAIDNLDPTSSHRLIRKKGETGKAIVYDYKFGQGLRKFEYNNEDYIKEYEERAQKLKNELNLKAKSELADETSS